MQGARKMESLLLKSRGKKKTARLKAGRPELSSAFKRENYGA